MLHAVLGVVIGTICYCLNDVDCSLGRLMVVPVFLFFSFFLSHVVDARERRTKRGNEHGEPNHALTRVTTMKTDECDDALN